MIKVSASSNSKLDLADASAVLLQKMIMLLEICDNSVSMNAHRVDADGVRSYCLLSKSDAPEKSSRRRCLYHQQFFQLSLSLSLQRLFIFVQSVLEVHIILVSSQFLITLTVYLCVLHQATVIRESPFSWTCTAAKYFKSMCGSEKLSSIRRRWESPDKELWGHFEMWFRVLHHGDSNFCCSFVLLFCQFSKKSNLDFCIGFLLQGNCSASPTSMSFFCFCCKNRLHLYRMQQFLIPSFT